MAASDIIETAKQSAATLVAPFLQFCTVIVLLIYVAELPVGEIGVSTMQRIVGNPDSPSFRFLRETELLKLTPFAAVFVFLVALFVLRDAIRQLGQVVPPHVVLRLTVLTARLSPQPHVIALWNANPAMGIHDVLVAASERLRRRVAESLPDYQADLVYWAGMAEANMRAFDAFKVLSFLACCCAGYAIATGHSLLSTFHHLLLALVVLVSGGIATLYRSLYCRFQVESRLMGAWSFKEDLWDGQSKVPATPHQVMTLEAVASESWWIFRYIRSGSLSNFLSIMIGKNPPMA